MKSIYFAVAIGMVAAQASAATPECSSVKDKMARLACYDKGAAVAPTTSVPLAASVPKEKPQEGEVFRSGMWNVIQSKDAMTDKKNCTALYKNGWNLQGTENTLYLSMKGRGGVAAYILRIDDEAPNSLRLASDVDKRLSAINFQPDFQRIYDSKRIRVQISTILNSMVIEDIDMHGFKESVDYIRQNCQA
jgi:hypothetical protein